MARNKNLTMKLLIDTNSHKILFAEAGKDVVDFLFSLLGLPLGAVIKLLTTNRMVGSMGGLYQSLEVMDDTYLYSNQRRACLLDPVVASSASLSNVLLLPATAPEERTSNYTCSTMHHSHSAFGGYATSTYYTDVSGTLCPHCQNRMTTLMKYVEPANATTVTVNAGDGGKGYVKGVVTYTVMDDLTVTPMSNISSITLLNKFQVKDVSALKETNVTLDLEKGLELLRCSLQSKTVLTDVFLATKKE